MSRNSGKSKEKLTESLSGHLVFTLAAAGIAFILGAALGHDMCKKRDSQLPIPPTRSQATTYVEETAHNPNVEIPHLIDTLTELQEFLGIKADNNYGSETRAHITAFQEKCNYVLGFDIPITGRPTLETYVAANKVNDSPALKSRLESGRNYNYVNREIAGHQLQIPVIALASVRERLQGSARDYDDDVLDYRDQTVVRIAETVAGGVQSPKKKARIILRFVQALPYNYDIDHYAKHPLETLADGGGDCEDTSVLFASLAAAAGLDSALVLMPDHAIGAVDIGREVGWHFEHGDRTYTLAETASRWELGVISDRYQNVNITQLFLLRK